MAEELEGHLTLEKLVKEYEPLHNHICLLHGTQLVRLLGVEEREDDFYYIVQGLREPVTRATCVGHCDSLKYKVNYYPDEVFTINGCPPTEKFEVVEYKADRDWENSEEGIRHQALGNLSLREIRALGIEALWEASEWNKPNGKR